jgi:hypothetical protein
MMFVWLCLVRDKHQASDELRSNSLDVLIPTINIPQSAKTREVSLRNRPARDGAINAMVTPDHAYIHKRRQRQTFFESIEKEDRRVECI